MADLPAQHQNAIKDVLSETDAQKLTDPEAKFGDEITTTKACNLTLKNNQKVIVVAGAEIVANSRGEWHVPALNSKTSKKQIENAEATTQGGYLQSSDGS